MIIKEMMRKLGPWTKEEDSILTRFISLHGQGPHHWNSLALSAGLKRSGKSCRLRWMNYLRPGVRRGNISLHEQFLILHLHSLYGNRWSKIAQHLPGRTDNDIKNYWRTRVQKQAKQLNCHVNSQQFRDAIRHLLLPRLVQQIHHQTSSSSSSSQEYPTLMTNPTMISTRTNYAITDDQVEYLQTSEPSSNLVPADHASAILLELDEPSIVPDQAPGALMNHEKVFGSSNKDGLQLVVHVQSPKWEAAAAAAAVSYSSGFDDDMQYSSEAIDDYAYSDQGHYWSNIWSGINIIGQLGS